MSIRCRNCSFVNHPDAEGRMKPWCVGCGSGIMDAGESAETEAIPARFATESGHRAWSGLSGIPPVQSRSRKSSSPGVMFGIGIVVLGMGIYSLVHRSSDVINGWSSRNWPKTRGTIARSWLEEWVSTRSGHTFELHAIYQYEVAGIRYQNDKVEFSNKLAGGGREFANKELAKIAPDGKACDVYYDPNRPSCSCLVPGITTFYLIFMPSLTLFFFFIGGVSTWVSAWKMIRDVKIALRPRTISQGY
jgi:hypothetical protein